MKIEFAQRVVDKELLEASATALRNFYVNKLRISEQQADEERAKMIDPMNYHNAGAVIRTAKELELDILPPKPGVVKPPPSR